MTYDTIDSPSFAAYCSTSRHAPYGSALRCAASASTASVCSDAASQSSDDSSISTNSSDTDSCDSVCLSNCAAATTAHDVVNHHPSLRQQPETEAVPAELRRNPRRSAPGSHAGRRGCPPALVRQSDRKVNFVDGLVDSATQIVEAIWPLSSAVCRSELGSKAVLPLRTFIQETLRRSRTSYSTLQVALYYLILIKPHVPKHNLTTEQPDDGHAGRALQCGRRMFLAALILASKYLQDRNYSARAWSKISGLKTQEINQNEIAFLVAVNWKLHITDDVFQRWTEIVLRFTPPFLPTSSSGATPQTHAQQFEWKQLILKLESELTNIEGLVAIASVSTSASDLCVLSPRSILNIPQEAHGCAVVSEASMPTPMSKACNTPVASEPLANTVLAPGGLAPCLGFLPTPRLTPRTGGVCTPAVSAASHFSGKGSAMGLAMAHANSVSTTQAHLDRRLGSVGSSPMTGYCPARRSSLANSISTASSPESMVSDSSRSSCSSSSASSASSLASATLFNNNRCSVPLRSRVAKLWNDGVSLKPSVPPVPEDLGENYMASPSELYTVPETKLGDLTLTTPCAVQRGLSLGNLVCDAASDAARVLQDLHNHDVLGNATPTATTGRKRSRGGLVDSALHENVRKMLIRRYDAAEPPSWADTVTGSRGMVSDGHVQASAHPAIGPRTVKRVCCSTEAASVYQAAGVHPGMSFRGRAMWDGILN